MAIRRFTVGFLAAEALGAEALGAEALGAAAWWILLFAWPASRSAFPASGAPELEKRLGEPDRRYRAAVACWRPRFPGYSPPEGLSSEASIACEQPKTSSDQ